MHLTTKRKWALALLALAATGVLFAVKVHRQKRVTGDFARYYTAGRLIVDGRADQLYDEVDIQGRFTHHFKYLTIFAVCMIPLALLPYWPALWVWSMLHVLAYAVAIAASYRIARAGSSGRSIWWMALPVACTLRLFTDNLQLGQINPIVIALALAGLAFFAARRDLAAGLLVALGASIKFTPVLFVLLFLLRRRWKAALSLAAGVLLFAIAVPSVVLGPARNARLTRRYLSIQGGLVTDPRFDVVAGQSLKALSFRYLTHMNAVHMVKYNEPVYTNVVDWSPETAFAVYLVSSILVLLAAGAFTLRRARDPASDARLEALQASAIAIAMLLLSPESRRAHFLILLLPFTALTYVLLSGAFRGSGARAAILLALAGMALVALPARGLVGKRLATLIDAHTNMGFAALFLLAAVLLAGGIVIRASRAAPLEQRGP